MKTSFISSGFVAVAALSSGFMLSACADDDGDKTQCPTCDNMTELLVGTKCVPIAEVEACGPDGHLHGTECHCFGGQSPTAIGGASYCLQAACSDDSAIEVDLDAEACAHHEDAAETVVPAATFAEFDSAHVGTEVLAELSLPALTTSYLHFEADETGHVLVYLSHAEVFVGAYNAAEQPLETVNLGVNADCPADFAEVWEVHVVTDAGTVAPQILAFAPASATTVSLVLLKEHAHE